MNDNQLDSALDQYLFLHYVLGGSPEVVLQEFSEDPEYSLKVLRDEIVEFIAPPISKQAVLARVENATDGHASSGFDYVDYLRRTLNLIT